MRRRTNKKNGNGNGNGNGGRREESTSNQLAFNVICLALAVGGNARTEPCESEFED